MDNLSKIRSTRHLSFNTTKEGLQEWVKQYEDAAKDDSTGVKAKELLLVNFIIYEAIYLDVDFKQLEDVYQRVVEQNNLEDEPDFPLLLKLEFLYELHALQEDLGHITRSEKIRGMFEKYVEQHPEDTNAGFLLIKWRYEVSLERILMIDTEITNYLKDIDDMREKYEFSTQEIFDLNFRKEKLIVDYYSNCRPTDGFKYIDNMVKMASESKRIYDINWVMDQLMGYGLRFIDEFESYLAVLTSLVSSILDGKDYQKYNRTYMHSGILTLGLLTKREKKKEAVEWGKELLDHIEYSNLETQCALNFKIMISLLLYANDNESIDQGELLKMKKEFQNIVDKIGSEDEYYVYYSGIGLFGILVQILQAMGMYFDPDIPLKYEKFLKDQKMSYIKFFSSLESYLDPNMKEAIENCLTYIDEINWHELSPTRIVLNIQSASLHFMVQDQLNLTLAITKYKEIVGFLKKNVEKYDYIEQKLFQCYSVLIPLSTSINDKDMYLEYIDDYIDMGIRFSENRDTLHQAFMTYIGILLQTQQYQKAKLISEKQVKYTVEFARPNKYYADSLKYHILALKSLRNDFEAHKIVPAFAQEIEAAYGKNSPEFVDAKKELANTYLAMNDINRSYKECLEAYDIAKEIYGGEKSSDAADIIVFMAIIKSRLFQFDEANNFIKKGKEIEEQMTSIYSQRYKSILQLEEQIKEAQEKFAPKNKVASKKGKKSIISTIVPNTPLKIGIYASLVLWIGGAIYWYKKKKE